MRAIVNTATAPAGVTIRPATIMILACFQRVIVEGHLIPAIHRQHDDSRNLRSLTK